MMPRDNRTGSGRNMVAVDGRGRQGTVKEFISNWISDTVKLGSLTRLIEKHHPARLCLERSEILRVERPRDNQIDWKWAEYDGHR